MRREMDNNRKECYAIIYCMKKTGIPAKGPVIHVAYRPQKKLIYIDNETSKKVKRWKLFIQEFDFYIEYIACKGNVAADGFSRLLPLKEKQLHHLWR